VLVVVHRREPVTVEGFWPRQVKVLKDLKASSFYSLAQRATRTNQLMCRLLGVGCGRQGDTHWHVDRAEEELEVGGAAILDKRHKRLQPCLGVPLQLVAKKVGHSCALIVLIDGALLQLDRLATQLLFSPREGAIAPPEELEQK